MDSVTILNASKAPLPLAASPVSFLCSTEGMLIGVTRTGSVLVFAGGSAEEVALLPLGQTDAIVAVQPVAVSDSATIAVASRRGSLWLVAAQDYQGDVKATVEEMGVVEDGVLAMAWSPDGELVALITGNASVVMMTREFVPLGETPLRVDDRGEAVPVSVGWGRKETQFHGKAGKQAALHKAVEPDLLMDTDKDDAMPRASWRGDGQFFVVSSVDEGPKPKRTLRVYSREGVLQSTSETVAMLEHPLHWRPSGNLIASTQQLPNNRHDVVFFERNGLRHGEFSLPSTATTPIQVVDVAFNAASNILMVVLAPATVQLWTTANYHWYLKQQVDFDAPVSAFHWDAEVATRLYVATDNDLHTFNLAMHVLANTAISEANPATVSVIDGATLLVTPFALRNVPPPMSAYSIRTEAPVRHVAYGPTGLVAALLSNGSLALIEDYKVTKTTALGLTMPLQVAVVSSTRVLVLMSQEGAASVALVDISAPDDAKTVATSKCPQPFLHWHYSHDPARLLLETAEGSFFTVAIDGDSLAGCAPWDPSSDQAQEYEDGHGLDIVDEPFQLDSPATQLALVRFSSGVVLVALSDHGRLYLNSKLACSNATSFFVHADFLIVTTAEHLAHFVPLGSAAWKDVVLQGNNTTSTTGIETRTIERGGKIVTAVATGIALVLQLPRGNLETVYPRPLVVSSVCSLLDKYDYLRAFALCRSHRVDMNLLFDHDPDAFAANVDAFVEQLNDADKLNLFLSNLRNEYVPRARDVVNRGILKVSFSHAAVTARSALKTSTICGLVRGAIEKRPDSRRFLRTVLTSYVCCTPADLPAALAVVQKIKGEHEEAADALEYLACLSDPQQLYDGALGLYDLDLVLVVAQQSQKDPRDYLPFLASLQKLEPAYQKFTIDDLLKRHSKAVAHLFASGPSHLDEFMAYMSQHGLYPTVLSLLQTSTAPIDPAVSRRIYDAYATHLRAQHKPLEAGYACVRASNLTSAIDCFMEAKAWKEALSLVVPVAAIPGAPIPGVIALLQADYVELALRIANQLKQSSLHIDAAFVFEHHAQALPEAIASLAEGQAWTDAWRVCAKHNRLDLLQATVIPTLVATAQRENEAIKALLAKAQQLTGRLAVVRREKEERNRLRLEQGLPMEDDALADDDARTETASLMSSSSRRTGSSKSSRRTSKSKRKDERKKHSSREGGRFEEYYLMDSLSAAVNRTNALSTSVGPLLRALFQLGGQQDTLATDVQQSFGELAEYLADNIAAYPRPESMPAPVAQEGSEEDALPTIPTLRLALWRLDLLGVRLTL